MQQESHHQSFVPEGLDCKIEKKFMSTWKLEEKFYISIPSGFSQLDLLEDHHPCGVFICFHFVGFSLLLCLFNFFDMSDNQQKLRNVTGMLG